MKKTSSFILIFATVVMLLSSVGVNAATVDASKAIAWNGSVATSFAGGTGTQTDPYIIADGSQLAYLAELVTSNGRSASSSKYFKLVNNIDLDGRELYISLFCGTFDGNGYSITGLSKGLFGILNPGVVSNLHIVGDGTNIDASKGILCEKNNYGTIEYCSISGTFNVTSDECYGFSVYNNVSGSSKGLIQYCTVKDAVFQGAFREFSSLSGFNYGNVTYCLIDNLKAKKTALSSSGSNSGVSGSAMCYLSSNGRASNITAKNVHIDYSVGNHGILGGLIGYVDLGSSIVNSSFQGKIDVTPMASAYSFTVGGFVGDVYNGTISRCSAEAEIKTSCKNGKLGSNNSHSYGVFCGHQQGTIQQSIAKGSITNVYAPAVREGKIYMGGFTGVIVTGGQLKNCAVDSNIVANAANAIIGNVCGRIVYTSSIPSNTYGYTGSIISGGEKEYAYNGETQVARLYERDFLEYTVGLTAYQNRAYLTTDYNAVWKYGATGKFPTIATGVSDIVVYCPNGDSSVPAPHYVTYDQNTVFAMNTATRAGYKFKEWNEKADGTGTAYLPGSTDTSIKGFRRLYAIWEPIYPETVTLTETNFALAMGGTKTVYATVLPDDAADKSLTWTSSDNKVATVNNGIVTGVGEGVATITATTKLGGISASCRVRVSAQNGGVCGNDAVWKVSDGVLYISGEGTVVDYKSAGAPWYSNRDSITKVVVGEGITEIGEFAFYGCSALEEAELPLTLKTVAKGAFYKCSALSDVAYAGVARDYVKITVESSNTMLTGATVTYFDAGTAPATQVVGLRTQTVEFDEEWNDIYVEVFDSNTSAGIAVVTEGVDSLDDYTTVSGNGVTVENSDGYRYFVFDLENGKEQKFEIYANVNGVDYTYNVSVKFVDYLKAGNGWTLYHDGTIKITEEMAMWSTPDLVPWHEYRELITSVEIAEGITMIGMNAFRDCTALTTVTIPDSVKSVAAWAFLNCTSLTDVYYMDYKPDILVLYIDGGNEYFEKATFHYMDVNVTGVSLDLANANVEVEGNVTLTATVAPENATNKNILWSSSDASVATVENGVVTGVGVGTATITVTTEDGGFTASCSVTVSDGIEIGPGGNQGSTGSGVTEVASGTCGDSATWSLSNEGVLVISGSGVMTNFTAKTTPWYEYRNDVKKIVVTGVATIGEYAFNYCTNATEVIIEEGVKVIYRNAFAYCSSIKTFYLPSTLSTVSKAVFYNCSALTDVYYNGTLGDYSKITVEGSNAPLSAATIHYTTAENAPAPQVVGLRTEKVSYNAETNTVTAVALNTNASAGVAIVVDGVASLSDYTTVTGNGFTVANSGGYRYFVAKVANGAEQATEIYATVDGVTYTYKLEFSFVDEVKTESPIGDIATLRCYEASWSDTNKTISVNVDRFPIINVSGSFGVAVVPAEGYTVTYEFTGNNSSTGATSKFSNSNTSKYTLLSTGVNTESSGGGALGNLPMKIITKVDATRFYVNVILSNGETSVTYKMTVGLRDRAASGDVDVVDILPLRADSDSFVIDNEAKTISYETIPGARSAGFAVKVDNGLTKATRPRRLLTAVSGYYLAHGEITDSNKNDYDRYVVARKSAGTKQTYKIKIHGGDDGLTYTTYTVNVVFK